MTRTLPPLRLFALWTGVCVLFGCMLSLARADEAPQKIEGTVKVTAEQVFTLFDSTPGLVIVDSRLADGPSSGRAQGFIEGSVSLPDIDTDCAALARVLPTKEVPALFYCNGPKCGRSVAAIGIARACGYSNLYWFRGGFKEWSEKGYPFLKE